MNSATTTSGPFSTLLRLTLIVSLLLSILLLSAPPTHADPSAPDSNGLELIQLPAEALTAPIVIEAAAARAPGSKMESVLTELATAAHASEAGALEQAANQSLHLSDNRVQVQVTTDAARADAATEAIRQAGGEVTGRANGDAWLQAWVPVTQLEAISQDDNVDYLSRPGEVVTMATTEGSAVMNAPAWHSAGLKGAGVKVAVIDAGFSGYKSLLGSELPASVTARNFVDGETDAQADGTTEHGTACAEVVHDIAPSASILLGKVNTTTDLEEAVNWAKAQGANIISTSLGWYNQTPGDGTGFFANLVQSARSAGIFWTTAASNDREAHWGGAFNGNSSGYHQFSGTQTVDFFGPGDGSTAYLIPAGNAIRAFLRWDDWSAKNQDYDLYVVRWNGSVWAAVGAGGQNDQNGGAGQTPTEFVSAVTSGSSAAYGIVIKRYSSNRNVNLELFTPKVKRLDKIVTARSLGNLADAPAAMTVAALDVKSPYPQESYSSEGPTNGPGGTANGGLMKPDIAGFANVATTSYPNNTFNGTSSATPHVAGAAALVKGANPGWTPAQVQSFLEGRAIDMGASGKDTLYGWGRLYLGAPSVPVNTKKVFLPIIIRSLPAPVLNAINNGGSGNYAVSWSAVDTATTYILEEARMPDCAGATTVYSGSGTSWQASNKAVGTYYYHVKAARPSASSGWSNIEAAVVPAPIPAPPVLNPISNPNAGAYAVTWNAVTFAQTYTLEEATDAAFTNPTVRYSGPQTSWSATNQVGPVYYYRVKAANAWGESSWSNTQAVSFHSYTGTWNGKTSQNKQIYFRVAGNAVPYLLIYYSIGNCSIDSKWYNSINLVGDTFEASMSGSGWSVVVTGRFDSDTTASGTLNATESFCGGSVDATWSATKQAATGTSNSPNLLDDTAPRQGAEIVRHSISAKPTTSSPP